MQAYNLQDAIEATIASLEQNQDAVEDWLDTLSEAHPQIFAYLLSEEHESLSEEEGDMQFFLAGLIYHIVQQIQPIEPFSLADISDKEEAVLETIESARGRDPREVFFPEGYPYGELIGLVEDILYEHAEGSSDEDAEYDDESLNLTPESLEMLFVSGVTLIDVFTGWNREVSNN